MRLRRGASIWERIILVLASRFDDLFGGLGLPSRIFLKIYLFRPIRTLGRRQGRIPSVFFKGLWGNGSSRKKEILS